MKRMIWILSALALLGALAAAPAQAEFGLKGLDVTFTDEEGQTAMAAGTHPFAWTTTIAVNEAEDPVLGKIPDGQVRDLTIESPPGLIGSPDATPRCEGVDFATFVLVESGVKLPNCSDSSVVGLVAVEAASSDGARIETRAPLYNLVPPPGVAAKFGFLPFGSSPVTIEASVKETPPYNLIARVTNITQTARFFSSVATIWGNPSDPSHDGERGRCGFFFKQEAIVAEPGGLCPTSNPNRPFILTPRSCTGPLTTTFTALSWGGELFEQGIPTHDDSEPPLERGFGGCEKLGLQAGASIAPTNQAASSPSGLAVDVDVEDPGIGDPGGTAKSDIAKAVLTLPEGVTANPSQAEGLEACSEAQLAGEKSGSEPGEGCPQSSKIGTVEVETPLLEGTILKGSLFVAKPYANRFGTLLALYMTVKEPRLGINAILAGKVEPDPRTGQLVTTFDDLPQVPVGHFRVRLREGGRSPLITPSRCGTYTSVLALTPSAAPATSLPLTSTFQITSGPGGGPCPPPGTPPFDPGFSAGSLNNDAAAHSPFYMRLTRRDGDQDLTRFAATLPPGLTAKLAGVQRCGEAQIAAAKAKSGSAELAAPSCPPGSLIGHTVAGAGTGSQLTFIDGSLYLAGPYNGAPLSVVAITPAVAGPFDVGTVVVRQALEIDPRTGVATADGEHSDPIPHILAGIPLSVRDIRVNVDRPGFILNPTSCDPFEVSATLWGGGSNLFSGADDSPFARSDRFQAANCAGLGFAPRLSLNLKGGTRRGAFPRLQLAFRPRPGDANLQSLVLRFPRSEFIEQGHFRTICTRTQFAAGEGFGAQCPKDAVYGQAKVISPLLDEPIEGPVYLRSSSHNLPDVVLALHGPADLPVEVEVPARIDSIRGGLRATVTDTPDLPVSLATVQMQGGQKGLFVNSTDICAARHRARLALGAHNAKRATLRPPLRAQCAKGAHKSRSR